MRILHVISGLRRAAGTSAFCAEVANGMARVGYDVTVAIRNPSVEDLYPLDANVKLISINSLVNDARSKSKLKRFDIVHIHAMWEPILHVVSTWALREGVPIVWSPHGMLTRWAFRYKWWKKLPAWWLYQKRDMSRASILHVTADREVADVRRVGLKNDVFVAPLGVNISDLTTIGRCNDQLNVTDKDSYESLQHVAKDQKIHNLTFIGRVAPIKGLANLCEAFSKTNIPQDWRLVIVGPDQEGHAAELKKLVDKLGVADKIEFAGPRYGNALNEAYDLADVFVLPSYSENFGNVVIEALAHSVPVITTKGTPWAELEEHKCGWWIDIGVEPLANALREAVALTDEERHLMGERGHKLVEKKYTWDAVVKSMVKGYEDILK